MDLKKMPSSSDSDGENVDMSVKILINDITPCDSREFLAGTLFQVASQADLSARPLDHPTTKGVLQRRATWSGRVYKKHRKLRKWYEMKPQILY